MSRHTRTHPHTHLERGRERSLHRVLSGLQMMRVFFRSAVLFMLLQVSYTYTHTFFLSHSLTLSSCSAIDSKLAIHMYNVYLDTFAAAAAAARYFCMREVFRESNLCCAIAGKFVACHNKRLHLSFCLPAGGVFVDGAPTWVAWSNRRRLAVAALQIDSMRMRGGNLLTSLLATPHLVKRKRWGALSCRRSEQLNACCQLN